MDREGLSGIGGGVERGLVRMECCSSVQQRAVARGYIRKVGAIERDVQYGGDVYYGVM
jgi:hypothetical protein